MHPNSHDRSLLKGSASSWEALAVSILRRVAEALKVDQLIEVSQVHLVGSYYAGKADFTFIKQLAEQGAKVQVPTTLSSGGLDHTIEQETDEYKRNCELVSLYQEMGCQVELTCAPYHLPSTPSLGENIAWAESNAVVYANSVLGARTNMTYQYLDLFAALTGKIPAFGMYLEENRLATRRYDVTGLSVEWLEEDAVYHLIGTFVGRHAQGQIPVIEGIPKGVNKDQLRALGAALATTGSSPMFHAVGVTPEALTLSDCFNPNSSHNIVKITKESLLEEKSALCSPENLPLGAICLGSPHFSREEFDQFIDLMCGQRIHRNLQGIISTSRHVKLELKRSGKLKIIEETGFQVLTDTCTYYGSSLKVENGFVMTNSAKWAYYAPGNLGVEVFFASLSECLEAAVTGKPFTNRGFWYD